jgi:hypothetical protein
MNVIVERIRWILFVSGALTCTMFYATFAPAASLRSNFGASLEGAVADIVVRNWGALIGIVGLMLIYAAVKPAVRRLVVTVAAASKLIFISLVLTYGREFLGYGAGLAVGVDSACVLLFVTYLLGTRSR